MKIKKEDLKVLQNPLTDVIQDVWLGPEKVAHINLLFGKASVVTKGGQRMVANYETQEEGISEALDLLLNHLNK